jgi:hypothetical protein
MTVIVESISAVFELLTPPNLGDYRVSNNVDIPITVSDIPVGLGDAIGTITFNLTSGDLPPSLQLDSITGYIYGYLEYQTDYLKEYTFTITATKTFPDPLVIPLTTSSAFTMNVKGFIDENIEWITTSSLETIILGYVSDLKVEAVETINNAEIQYTLTSGALPPGLNLTSDGAICGQVEYGSTGTYNFTVLATTKNDKVGIGRSFNLMTSDSDGVQYTKIYFKPFISKEKRREYQNFINNPEIFDQHLIYRYFDTNFGVQSELKMVLDFGIEKIPLDQYTQALRQNFYKRRFTLGKVKTAIAKDESGNSLYEVIYIDVVDSLKDVALNLYSNRNVSVSYSGGSAGQILYNEADTQTDSIYYPASIKNMRIQLSRIQLDDYSTIKVNRYLEPQYMRSLQPDTLLPTNYIAVIPLCYTKPGQSRQIIKKIAAYNFKFNMVDFEIDRLIVQNSLDHNSAKYLLFGRESISDTLVTDTTLYQGDVFWQFDDGVQLTRTT